MINLAMKFIVDELNTVIRNTDDDSLLPAVQLGNISMHESGNDAASADMASSIIVTMINIEEEKTLKNSPTVIREGDTIKKIRPIIFLNLYVLFSSSAGKYEKALLQISRVIQFFQSQNVFFSGNTITTFPDRLDRLVFDFYPLTFEQQNHIWGIMSSKMVPSVAYKIRMVTYQDDLPIGADIITKIRNNAN